MSYLSRWAVEIIPNEPRWDTHIQAGNIASAPAATDPIFHPKPPIDVTDRLLRDGIGSVNRAAERDLLSFRTGDVTVTLDDRDGFLTDLFSLMTATNRWQFRIFKDGAILFHGMLLGLGSIKFDVKARNCEVTAYGLTKILDDTSAESVARGLFAGLTVTTATLGASTLTISSTALMLTGDVLHLTDEVNKEDVTVKQVTSGTAVSLEAPLTHAYASGSAVTNTTPFHRYKTIDYLVRALFNAAQTPVAEVLLDNSQFKKLAPDPVNRTGINVSNRVHAWPAERNGRRYETVLGVGTFYQSSPDADWVQEDATDRPWVDPSRYFMQGEAIPISLRCSVDGEPAAPSAYRQVNILGYDFGASPKRAYLALPNGSDVDLDYMTTSDGTTWSAPIFLAKMDVGGGFTTPFGVAFDRVRNAVYAGWQTSTTTCLFKYVDAGSGAVTDLKQVDDGATTGYYGPTYIPELDLVLACRGTDKNSGALQIAAFRGPARLWVRDLPAQPQDNPSTFPQLRRWPSLFCRYFNGSIYTIVTTDGAIQLLRTDDLFQTYRARKLSDNTSTRVAYASRIGNYYAISAYNGSAFTNYLISAPFYAGVVNYLDLANKSVAEGLKTLSVIGNAVFWLDDSGQGHFVARDLFPPNSERDITDDIMERSDTLIWDQTAQFVTVSGGSIAAQVSGNKAFAATGIDLSSDLVPNEAFAQTLADSYVDFYSRDRKELSIVAKNPNQEVYRPLDRVFIDGIRYLVYEADHDIAQDGVTMTVLEDA